MLHGGLVPCYYGSYTLDLHEPSEAAARAVCVLLMEYVRGCTLRDLHPARFSQRTRQSIIGDNIDVETAVFADGVFHRDLYPCNVLVVDPLLSSSSELQPPSVLPVLQLAISAKNGNSHEPDQTALDRPLMLLPDDGAAGPESGVRNGVSGRASSVVLINFGKVIVQNDEAQWSSNTLFKFKGIHIPPLLRWREDWWSNRQQLFDAWIDWEWQPWLEERYRHRQGDVTVEMQSYWLPEEMLEQLPNLGGDVNLDHDENWSSSWWGDGADGGHDEDELSGWCGHSADRDQDEDELSGWWVHGADRDQDEDELSE
jgi:serine/threonine protein kinase